MNTFIFRAILIIGDIFISLLALLATFKIRYGLVWGHSLLRVHILLFGIVFLFWIIIFWLSGLYEVNQPQKKSDQLRDLMIAISLALIFAIIFFYIFSPFILIGPRLFLAIATIIFSILFISWHFLYFYLLKSRNKIPIVLIGDSAPMESIKRAIRERAYFGYEIKGQFDSRDDIKKIIPILKEVYLAVISNYSLQNDLFLKKIFADIPLSAQFINAPAFYEFLTRKILLGGIGEVWFLENISGQAKKVFVFIKRIMDIFFSLLGLLVFIFFYPVIAFAIKWESQGPIFYKQERVGKDEKNFKVFKFRSMYVGAENAGPRWAEKNDPRITRIGRFLRKTRLDELPQVLNILKGEMSVVGPRPERPEFISLFAGEIPFYRQRTLVKPGLTGWAQVNYKYTATIDETKEKLQYDLYYIKNRSFLLDLEIILKTVKIILSQKGS